MSRCEYYDCGWCYAPDNVMSNNTNGACYRPQECPQMTKEHQKPDCPNPQLIEEDVLAEKTPDLFLEDYRIKKVVKNGETKFYPQRMGFFRWRNFLPLGYSFFRTYHEANKYLCYHIMQEKESESSVEYFNPDFSFIKKELNPQPKNP